MYPVCKYVCTHVCMYLGTYKIHIYVHTYVPSFTKPVSHYSNNTRPATRLKIQVIIQLHT